MHNYEKQMVSLLQKIANKIQGAQSGFIGVVRKPTLFAVAERRPEEVYIGPPGSLGEKTKVEKTIVISPTFNIVAVDASGVRKLVREKIFPELVALIETNYKGSKTKFKEVLNMA